MMSENARLSQPTTDEQGGDGTEEKSSDVDDLWGDMLIAEADDKTPKKKVILVMGSAGSGVLTTASQVLNRLTVDNAADSDSSSLKSVCSALVVIDLSQEFPEKVTRDGVEALLARRDSDSVVVCIITSAAFHTSITSVISKMEACGCHISYSIAVIAAQSNENYLRSHSRLEKL